MSELVVRRLLIDLNAPIQARWCGGDAFRSAFFNALSMSFPAGEQYFIDSVREGLKTLPEVERQKFAAEVQGFIGQEATHRRLHGLFNVHLTQLGFTNEIERRALARMKANAGRDKRIHVGSTAATEHFTAIFADWMLRHPEALAGAEPRLQTLWFWHCAEESEHRCTAFDLYKAMGGDQKHRILTFRYITVVFLGDVLRQTVRILWQDKSLFKWSTWRSAMSFLFSRDGIIRGNVGLWRDYLAPDFHPSQQKADLSTQWLVDNQAQYTLVGSVAG